MSIPMKNDIVINPNTNRPIKVGSATWRKLVKQGIFENRYRDPNELGVLNEEEHEEVVKEELRKVSKSLPRNQYAVKGRGKHTGKITSRSRNLKPEEVSKYTARIASKAFSNNIDRLVDSGENLEDELEKLILEEMLNKQEPVRKKVPMKRQGAQPKNTKYQVFSSEDDEEEVSEDEDFE